jgi:hypothetical protein
MTVFSNGVFAARAAVKIADLGVQTLAAGQAQVAAFGQAELGRRADEHGYQAVAAAQADLVPLDSK